MKDKLKKWLIRIFFCKLMQAHDWTSAAAEGIPPTDKQVEDGLAGFRDYAKMYCKRCGKVYEPYG